MVCLGYLVLRLPMNLINNRLLEREGMGLTGETYLVGPDLRMRSDSFKDPKNRNIKASLEGSVRDNGVDTQAARDALAGVTGAGIIKDYMGDTALSSYGPLELEGLKWAIIAERNKEEALAPSRAIRNITLAMAVAFAFIAFVLSLLASGRIVRPIRRLTEWSGRIAQGDLTLEDFKVPNNEIGLLNKSFREAVRSLRLSGEVQERHNWLKTGQADLDDRIRGEQEMETMCRNIITFIAKYLNAQVGALYINDGHDVYRLKASYAYKTRKNLSNEFKKGEGLIGQAALERETILLTDVPDDYIRVTSGLGEKGPGNILVMPFNFDDRCIGVIELGSLKSFSKDHHSFLEEASERIAIAMHSAMARDQLQEALKTTPAPG